MPIREYKCLKCDKITENIEKMTEPEPLKSCPDCGGQVELQFSAARAHFKGSGFYATDYGRKTKQ